MMVIADKRRREGARVLGEEIWIAVNSPNSGSLGLNAIKVYAHKTGAEVIAVYRDGRV